MKTYKAYLEQSGEGCDYTIGCGYILIDISANDMEEARTELVRIVKNEYNSFESRLDSVCIYEVSDILSINMEECYKCIDESVIKQEQQDIEDKEREDYLRLKNKFENN